MNALTQFLLRAGPGRLIAALGITAIVAAGLFTLMFRMAGEQKELLFGDLGPKQMQAIVSRLDTQKIPYELTASGTAVLVPRSKVNRLRIEFADVNATGSVVDASAGSKGMLGATQAEQDTAYRKDLEGELGRTILTIDGIETARVILALPERRIFEKDASEPSASVTLKLSAPLSAGQVRAVRNLVAGAVPRLSVQRVTVVDDTGRLLASGALGGDNAAGADGVDARQVSYEERVRKTVQDIVEGVVGPGKARVQVSAEMDFNRIESNSTTYDPDGRVAISTQSATTQAQSRDAAPNAATAGRNIPDATAAASGAGAENAENGSSESVSYVVSTTTKKELIEGGRLRRLSVAVAVDGVTTPGANGQPPQWAARDAAELERLTTLVRSAVGFDEKRGDRVDVVNVRFAPSPTDGTEVKKPEGFDLSQLDPMRGAELLAALIAALAFVFFVLRPLVGGLVRPPGATAATAALPDGASAAAGAAALPGSMGQLAAPAGDGALVANNELNVDLARIRGDVKASSIKQMAEIVKQHPDESVAILRGWLNNAF